MPRPRNHEKHVSEAVADPRKAVTGLVDSIHIAVTYKPEVRAYAADVKRDAAEVAAAAKAKSARLKKSLQAYGSKMKGKAREKRIAVMLEARGQKPKAKG